MIALLARMVSETAAVLKTNAMADAFAYAIMAACLVGAGWLVYAAFFDR